MLPLQPFQGWRLSFLQGVMLAIFLLLSLRLGQLQLIGEADAQSSADENRLSELPLGAPRGVILARHGEPLALNVPAFNITIIPADLPGEEKADLAIFTRLSALSGIAPTAALAADGEQRSIEELVREGEGLAPFRPVVIASDVPAAVAMQLLEERFELPGVAIDIRGVREYPTGALTAQVVGYMAPIPAEESLELQAQGYNPFFDRIGADGVEFFLEGELGGQRGSLLREVDVAGEVIRELARVEPQPGQNVRLTLDLELQTAAQRALENRIEILNANSGRTRSQSGVVIAMQPDNGEVLALVSWPTYDNSRFARAIDPQYYLEVFGAPFTPLVNHAISSLYPPGSVWKVITALGVLEENVIAPETRIFNPGSLVLPNRYAPNDPAASQTFFDWNRDGLGWLNIVGGLAVSSDVFFYQVGGGNPEVSPARLKEGGLGIKNLFRYASAMGIGSELGIELPGEQPGRMPDPDWKRRIYGENWSTGDTYNAAFGQGYVTTTPLQLISSVAAVVNGGTLWQPRIVDALLDAEGAVLRPFAPQALRHLGLEAPGADEGLRLTLLEDMIMKGPLSLACVCEENSVHYDAARCDPASYTSVVDINPQDWVEEWREYRVHVPYNYRFNASVCQPLRFEEDYQPPFVTQESLELVREGMRGAVSYGTATRADLPAINVAGKTGTAEYCDDVARPLGLCIPGSWPAHAWFTAYAPAEAPQILILAFVYNGGEGSAVALPVVVETLEAWMQLQNGRGLSSSAPL